MSKIEWTTKTWNPVVGCTKVSAGCKYCYAESFSRRLNAMGVPGYENDFKVVTPIESRLNIPNRIKKPTTFFVNSMSDMFHPNVPIAFIDSVMQVIKDTPQHTYQILTKRHRQMSNYFKNKEVPENVWLGVSVENKKHGLPRVSVLQKINAKNRFLSIEPLLENIGMINLNEIHWVIVGGESGRNARPMKPEWVENIKKQCDQSNIPFFFKQWGAWGADGIKRNKKSNGRLYKNKVWEMIPVG